MSFLTRWFKKSEPEDYEQILASLAIDIQKRQTRLSEIRLRERRATLVVTLYALAAWGAYVSAWYMGLLPNLYGGNQPEKLAKGAPVFVGPVLILFTRRIIQLYYARKGDAEEKTLKVLYKEQRTKIEDIKKKTNYYNTRSLLERYDEGPGSGAPNRRPPALGQPPQSLQPPSTPQRPGQKQRPGEDLLKTPGPVPLSPGLQNHLSPPPPQPMPTPKKQWYDKIADALLGDDETSAGPAASRYALICQKCFAHNGLVKESLWEDAQYVCPKCGHFNPSARSMKQGTASAPPSTNSSPQHNKTSPMHPSLVYPIGSNQSDRQMFKGTNGGEDDEGGEEETSMTMDVDDS